MRCFSRGAANLSCQIVRWQNRVPSHAATFEDLTFTVSCLG